MPHLVRTRHDWISSLASESHALSRMRLDVAVKDRVLIGDAFNLANDDAHRRMITRAIDSLIAKNALSNKNAHDLLYNLIQRNTYGAFAELAAYDWLTRCNLMIETQVKMAAGQVLATNGSTLDGKITHCDIYFDVKAFGSNGLRNSRLRGYTRTRELHTRC
jgi:hypothetical protein